MVSNNLGIEISLGTPLRESSLSGISCRPRWPDRSNYAPEKMLGQARSLECIIAFLVFAGRLSQWRPRSVGNDDRADGACYRNCPARTGWSACDQPECSPDVA